MHFIIMIVKSVIDYLRYFLLVLKYFFNRHGISTTIYLMNVVFVMWINNKKKRVGVKIIKEN